MASGIVEHQEWNRALVKDDFQALLAESIMGSNSDRHSGATGYSRQFACSICLVDHSTAGVELASQTVHDIDGQTGSIEAVCCYLAMDAA